MMRHEIADEKARLVERICQLPAVRVLDLMWYHFAWADLEQIQSALGGDEFELNRFIRLTAQIAGREKPTRHYADFRSAQANDRL